MPPFSTFIPILAIVIPVFAACFAWCWKQVTDLSSIGSSHYKELGDRTLVLEPRFTEKSATIEKVRDQQIQDAQMINRLRQDQMILKEGQRRADERHAEISQKLDAIPELTAAINQFSAVIQTIVPRSEHEARWDSTDKRMGAIEASIRYVRNEVR
jgi:hypothetical protein